EPWPLPEREENREMVFAQLQMDLWPRMQHTGKGRYFDLARGPV
ncbi:MAG: hypothetical protein, partial [Olavius algarvensis Gamma 3 endosymbiont]